MKSIVRVTEALHLALFAAFLVAPFAYFFAKVLPQAQSLNVLAEPGARKALWNSLVLSISTSLVSTVLGFGFSWLLWRYAWPRRLQRAVSLLLKIPYLLPPFFFAMGWVALAAPVAGYLNLAAASLGLPQLPSIYGIGGAIFVLVLWSTALAMIQLQSFFTQYPGSLEDAAVICGASPGRALLKITLPLALPQLAACMLLTGANALAAFGVPALLAAPVREYVLTTRIYQSIRGTADFSQAALLSVVLLAVTLALMALQRFLVGRRAYSLMSAKAERPAPLKPSRGAQAAFFAAVLFAFVACVLPVVAMLLQSLLRDRADVTSFTLEKYSYVLTEVPDGMRAMKNSLASSLGASVAATALAIVIAYGASRLKHRVSSLIIEGWNLAYAIPGTVIALTLLSLFSGTLTDTLWILVLAYFVKYCAFPLRTITPSMQAIAKEMEEAAWMSGASKARAFFAILVPMLKPAISAALLLALIPMLSELTMSVLLVGAGTDTLGTLIYRFLEYSDPGAAAVLATTLTGATLLFNLALRKLSKGSFGI